jgi:hypothetical protein
MSASVTAVSGSTLSVAALIAAAARAQRLVTLVKRVVAV